MVNSCKIKFFPPCATWQAHETVTPGSKAYTVACVSTGIALAIISIAVIVIGHYGGITLANSPWIGHLPTGLVAGSIGALVLPFMVQRTQRVIPLPTIPPPAQNPSSRIPVSQAARPAYKLVVPVKSLIFLVPHTGPVCLAGGILGREGDPLAIDPIDLDGTQVDRVASNAFSLYESEVTALVASKYRVHEICITGDAAQDVRNVTIKKLWTFDEDHPITQLVVGEGYSLVLAGGALFAYGLVPGCIKELSAFPDSFYELPHFNNGAWGAILQLAAGRDSWFVQTTLGLFGCGYNTRDELGRSHLGNYPGPPLGPFDTSLPASFQLSSITALRTTLGRSMILFKEGQLCVAGEKTTVLRSSAGYEFCPIEATRFGGGIVTHIACSEFLFMVAVRNHEGVEDVYASGPEYTRMGSDAILEKMAFPDVYASYPVLTLQASGRQGLIYKGGFFTVGCTCMWDPFHGRSPIPPRHAELCMMPPRLLSGISQSFPYWYPTEEAFLEPTQEESVVTRGVTSFIGGLLATHCLWVALGVDDVRCDLLSYHTD